MLKLTDAELANLRLEAWKAVVLNSKAGMSEEDIARGVEGLLRWLLQPRRDGE